MLHDSLKKMYSSNFAPLKSNINNNDNLKIPHRPTVYASTIRKETTRLSFWCLGTENFSSCLKVCLALCLLDAWIYSPCFPHTKKGIFLGWKQITRWDLHFTFIPSDTPLFLLVHCASNILPSPHNTPAFAQKNSTLAQRARRPTQDRKEAGKGGPGGRHSGKSDGVWYIWRSSMPYMGKNIWCSW